MSTYNAQSSQFLDFDIYQFPENELIDQHLKGSNGKQFLIILHCTEAEEKDLIPYLQKIMGSISIQLEEDTHYINLPKNMNLNISHLIHLYGFNKILLFGIAATSLSLNIQPPVYTVFSFMGKKWLSADALPDIFSERKQTNRPKAGALWNVLSIMQQD